MLIGVDGDDEVTPTSRRPVMSDVGRLAGVSHQTVSRVINGSRHVSPGTRERVLAAMRDLDYRPNSIARALVTGRTRTLGVVSTDTTLYGPASTLFGIERAAHEAGYFIIIASQRALDRSSVAEAIDRLRVHGVDGILVIVAEKASAEALLVAPPGVPLVAVEGGPERGIPVVAVDQRKGAELATSHLLELGHPTVHHIAGPLAWIEAVARLESWRATLAAAGAPIPEPLVGDWSARSGYHLGRRLAGDPSVSAVFVANDQMALGLLRSMHEAALMPFAALGIALGHLLNVDSIGPVMGGTVSLLALVSGTWFPVTHGFLHDLGQWLPSYWLVQAGRVAEGGHAWGARGGMVVLAWTVILVAVAIYAYRRDTSRV